MLIKTEKNSARKSMEQKDEFHDIFIQVGAFCKTLQG